jgi:hypothetical protein
LNLQRDVIKTEGWAFKQLDDGIGCIFVRAVLEKPRKKRTQDHVGNGVSCREKHCYDDAVNSGGIPLYSGATLYW